MTIRHQMTRGHITWFNVAVFCGFALLAIFLWIFDLNHSLFMFINSHHSILPDAIWGFYNFVAKPQHFILPILLLAITFAYRRDMFFHIVLLLVTFYLLFYGLKLAIGEPRPYVVLAQDSFYWLLSGDSNPTKIAYKSFPSGHTGLAAVTAFSLIALFFNNKKLLQFILFVIVCLVGLSRICTGWHWPIDVIASGLIGYFLVKVTFLYDENRQKKFK